VTLSLPTHNVRLHGGRLAVTVHDVAENAVQSFIPILCIQFWHQLESNHAEMIISNLLEPPRLDGFQGVRAISADGASDHVAVVATR